MKFSYSIVVAALLGAISQQDLVSGVMLNHRHHHKHHHAKHHLKHHPGVRFISTMTDIRLESEDSGASAADPGLVAEATGDSDPIKVAEENAENTAKKNKEQAAAIQETIKKASETKPVPEPTEQEVAAAQTPQTMEEYKDLKKEVKEAEAAAASDEKKEMSEDEVKAAEDKTVNQLTDKADAERHAKEAKEVSQEIANLEADKRLAQKIIADPDNTGTLEEIADAKLKVKKDEKETLKLKEQLAEVSTKMVEDKKKEAARTAEAAAQEEEERKAQADLALKKAKLAEFEEKKKEADQKVTKEFAEQLPDYTPKSASMPEDNKLKEAQQKIDALNAEEERKEEKRKAEIEAKKEEAGPNVADAVIAKAEAEFDQQKELERQKAAVEVEGIKQAITTSQKAQTQEREIVNKGPMTGEEWTANMPTYMSDQVPYKRPLQTDKAITAKAFSMSNAMKAF